MFFIITIIAIVAQGMISLLVLFNDRKRLANKLFFLLSLFVTIWASINFIITNNPHSESQLTLYRLLMLSVVIQNTFFFFFARTYPKGILGLKLWAIIGYLAISLIAAAATLSPFVFPEVDYNVVTGARPVTGPGMLIFVLHAAISVGFGMKAMIHRFKNSQGIQHSQMGMILSGSIVLWGVVPLTNFIVSLATQTLFFAQISPLYTLVFSSLIAYAIIRHRLFDIKRAAVRAVAYLLAITTVLCLYGFAVLFGVTQFFGFGSLSTDRQYLFFGLAAAIGLTISPLVRFFDGITQRIFFRKAYSTQQAIDDMTEIFVQSDTMEELLNDSSRLMMRILGASSVTVSLTHADAAGQRVAYTTLPAQAEHPVPIVTQAHMLAHGTSLVALDMLDDEQEELGVEMNGMNISVVSQLHSPVGVVGYLLLGYKQNSTHYGRQDLDFIDIVSDEFAIAIQSELRFEEIKAFNAELQRKIDEATRELKDSNEKLQRLDEAKDEFISMASHQLRTPLTTVKGYLSMVLEGDVGKVAPAQKKVLEEAYDSAQRMVFLIGDFLNVSRLQTGKFIMEWASADLSKVIDQEISQLQASATSRKLRLVYDAPASFPEMVVDETKLRQVMMNFIDNAIYYSKPDTTIDISLVKLTDEVVFKVTDHGIGVPMSERPRLFTKFYRASNAKKQRPDGTGIGLFMAKKVIVAHGGSVIFESKEGQGSTFGFRLPLKHDVEELEEQPEENK